MADLDYTARSIKFYLPTGADMLQAAHDSILPNLKQGLAGEISLPSLYRRSLNLHYRTSFTAIALFDVTQATGIDNG